MRFGRRPEASQYFTHLMDLSSYLRESNLVLAELSGIEVSQRREVAKAKISLCDSADQVASAVIRALRESYATPLDREDLYHLTAHLRDTCHRLYSVGFALSSPKFEELPVGVLETLAVLSNACDHTHRMLQRLFSRPDQWEYVEDMSRLYNQAEMLRMQISDGAPNSHRGLVYLSASAQLGYAFVEAMRSFQAIGSVVSEIAIKES